MNWTNSEFISHALELMNGVFCLLGLCATFIFGRYLWIHRKQEYCELEPVIAVLVLSVGLFIARGGIWGLRFIKNDHIPATPWVLFGASVIGSGIAAIGILCMIRVFSPTKWGLYPVIVSATIAFGLSFFMLLAF
jgi:hypothetical protein